MKPLFSSEDEAAYTWSDKYRALSEVKEHVALIYAMSVNGAPGFYLGRTYRGMGEYGPFRPNVALPFIYLYIVETMKERIVLRSKPVAIIHSHPRPAHGMTCRHHSWEDHQLLKLPGIDAVYVVPFENNEVNRIP